MPYDIVKFPDGYRVMSINGTWLSKEPLTFENAVKQRSAVGISEGGSASDPLHLHAIIVKKPISLSEARKEVGRMMKSRKKFFVRETGESYRFRIIPKTKFKSFVSKEVKPNITMVFGNLKLSGGDIPPSLVSRETLGHMAEDAYKMNPPQLVEGWTLIHNSPTVKAYTKDNIVVFEIRGTDKKSLRDLSADTTIPFNRLNKTDRYRQDVREIQAVKEKYPSAVCYAVGHSLGGAIIDNLIADGYIKEGLSFNPAVESKFYGLELNKRISHKDDPLLALMTNKAKGTEVVSTNIKQAPIVNTGISWLDSSVNKLLSPFSWVRKKLKAHTVGTIFGRGRGSCGEPISHCKCTDAFKKQLAKDGYDCKKYLADARNVASKAGYDPAMLDYAYDKYHKLAYTTPSGKVIRFGRREYGDYLIWSHLEEYGKVAKGYADMKRNVFHKSHENIKGRWRSDKYSPNNLALRILW